ncbi:MAG: hypothetical protein ACR2GH_11255 [Pseudonocardia sp.]
MNRTNTVSRAYLRWRQSDAASSNSNFLADPASAVDGQQVDGAELNRVIDLLVHRGLAEGPQSFNDPVPDPAVLTSQGVICVADHDGDVAAWNTHYRPAGYVDQSTRVSGHRNQVVAHSSNVNQSQHTEINHVSALRSVAEQALEGIDEYEIDDEDGDDVRRAAQRALDETADGEPEQGRLRRLASTLWAALLAFSNTAAGTAFAERLRDLLLPLVQMAV